VPKPGAGVHFGLRGLDQEESAAHCPSDTLFAALVATLADLGGDGAVRAFIAPFEAGEPPFLLTSAFPRAGDLPLLPLPFVRLDLSETPGRRKLFKGLRYVSPAIFHRALTGAPLDAYVQDDGPGAFLQQGQIWLTADEIEALPEAWRDRAPAGAGRRDGGGDWLRSAEGRRWLREQRVWASQPVDRVTVDRVSAAPALYRMGRTVYAPGCGLWLGVQWPGGSDSAASERLEGLLRHLGDRGLGGERSVGYGQFALAQAPLPLDLPAPHSGTALVTLSRYLPGPDEVPGALRGRASYGLDPIAGWLWAPGERAQRRKQVRMLREGSLFEPVGPGPWGRLADVRPDGWDAHPIWRWGYACPVGVPLFAPGGHHA